jgi:1-pyrroline-5-carboxylate dehydrogenase
MSARVVNETVLQYAPGSAERTELKSRLNTMAGESVDLPLIIGGKDVRTRRTADVVMPCDYRHRLGVAGLSGAADVRRAIDAAGVAAREWGELSIEDRAAVFERAADLLAGRWRATLNAATMLGQGKTVFQAEIDSACELIDFWRFNAHFAREIWDDQPISPAGVSNRSDYRPLEGFVYAVTPFNFTSIAGNLPTAPAIMGCTVIWKPAASALLSAHYIMRILVEAGLPPGVINLVPGDPEVVSDVVLRSRDLAGIHFTGSTAVFRRLWQSVSDRIDRYRSFPRLVGETGGKDFIVVHPSADLEAAAVAIVRGGFEYQGQKCSAASRVYVPKSRWPALREHIVDLLETLSMGDVRDFRNFMGAVIDRRAFDKIRRYQAIARRTARVISGGGSNRRVGFFVEPTLVEVKDAGHRLMTEEIFGPLVSVYVYPDRQWSRTLELVNATSPYALTGAVIATDRRAIDEASRVLRFAAGNFYVNDKPTGAVVGQQPFGGARASGTNDKAGSKWNLARWTSPRVLKETFSPARVATYPFMDAE